MQTEHTQLLRFAKPLVSLGRRFIDTSDPQDQEPTK
jgi:hypothetical protein